MSAVNWSADLQALAIYVTAGGVPVLIGFMVRAVKRANKADTKTAIDEAVEPLHEKIDGLAVQVAELRGEITGRSS